MTELKKYGLDTLARICAAMPGPLDETLAADLVHTELCVPPESPNELEPRKRYTLKADGLWLRARVKVVQAPQAELEVFQWAPNQDNKHPALPLPFSAFEFAAFTLSGCGALLCERFDGNDGGIDEEALDALGGWGDEAREVLRESHRLRLEATERYGKGKPISLDSDGLSLAVQWLLGEPLADCQKSPVVPAAEAQPAAPTAGEAKSIAPSCNAEPPPPLTTPEVADAFDGVNVQTAKQWRDKLGDVNNHQWLLPARAAKGAAPTPATWWPVLLAELLIKRGATAESLNRAFLVEPKLKPWLPHWQEKRRERNAFGQ